MKKLLRIIGVLVVVLSAAYVYLVKNVVPNYIAKILPQVEQLAPEYINGNVAVGSVQWDGGLSAEIHDVLVSDARGQKVAVLPRTILHFKPWLGMEKPARALSSVELLRPQVYLTRGDDEKWNMQHLLKPSDSSETPFYGNLSIKDGTLTVTMPQGEWQFGVNANVNGGANPDFAVEGKVRSGSDLLELNGTLNTKGEGNLQLQGDKLALAAFAPLAQHYAGIEELQGGLGKLALVYNNENGTQRFSGDVAFAGLSGKVQAGDAAHSFVLDGKISAHDSYLTTGGITAVIDGQKLQLEGAADLRDMEQPSGSGVLTAQSLTYEDYTVRDVRVPFVGDKKEIVVHDASLTYGGGKLLGNGTYTMDEKSFVGDVDVQQVTYTPANAANAVQATGKAAVLAKVLDDGIKLHAAADTVDVKWRGLTVRKMTLDGLLAADGLRVDHFSAFAGENGSLAASGTVGKNGALQLKARMADFPMDAIVDAATGKQGTGLVSLGCDITGTLDAPEFGGVVQIRQTEFMQQKIKEAHGWLALKDNVLTIKHLVANMEQGKHNVNGSVDLRGAEPVLDLALETDNVRIEPLVALVSPSAEVTGNLSNVMQVRGPLSSPDVYGEVHASDGSASKQLFNAVDGRYAYENGKLTLRDFVINAFAARVTLDGTMTKEQQLDFSMQAQNVNLAHLPIHEETVALTGLCDANGHLGGTLQSPYFDGDISSEKFAVNGETLAELSGTVASNAKDKNSLNVVFKQPYKNDPANYGMFSADVNLDFVQHFIKGEVLMMYGDIGGLLRMARQDYDINGLMQGRMEFSPQGKGSGVLLKVSADNVKLHDINYAHLNFDGKLQKGVLHFNDVRLQEQDGVTDKGIITVEGDVNLKERNLSVIVRALQANPAIATIAMKQPPEVKGNMDMSVRLDGGFDELTGDGVLTILDGSVAGVSVDSLTAALSLKDDHISLKELLATKDAYRVKADGDVPLDIFRVKNERRNPDAQMDIRVDLNEARLGLLPALTDWVEWATGDTHGEVRLAGTLEEPLLFGTVKIEDGNVKVKGITSVLENIRLDVGFDGNMVNLHELSTKLGKGSFTASGSYALHTDADAAYNLQLTAKDAEVASQIFTGRINADLALKPQKYRDFRAMKGNKLPPEQYRPQLAGTVQFDDVTVNMPTVPELGEGESNIGLDLALKLGKKVHLYNSYLYDIWLSGGIHIKGSTVFPMIDGNIKADKGEIKYLRTNFKLNHASLTWVDVGTFLPNVTLDSQARFNRYTIFMKINGPVSDNMELLLSSNPALDRNTIVRMLTLQRDMNEGNDVTSDDMTNLMTAGLEMAFLGDVEMFVKQNLGVDQFRIYSGKIRSGIGFESAKDRNSELTNDEKNQYNVLVSKYLTKNFMVGYTTSFDAKNKSVFGQFDISRHMNLTYSRSYKLDNDADNWYGVEYHVNF